MNIHSLKWDKTLIEYVYFLVVIGLVFLFVRNTILVLCYIKCCTFMLTTIYTLFLFSRGYHSIFNFFISTS